MTLEIAQMKDNEELLEFFRGFPLDGMISLKIDRSRDFFKYYALQSDQYLTYILRDGLRILGTVTFVMDEAIIEGEQVSIAWARDLRISPERTAVLSWTEHIQPVFKEIKKTFGVKYIFSHLNMSEVQSLNTFIRPRTNKRIMPKYFLYRRRELVSLHGQFPWMSSPLAHLKIRRGSEKYREEIIHYLVRKKKHSAMTTIYSEETLIEKIDRWQSLSWDDFFIAIDSKDKIVGVLNSWSSGGVQDFIPLRYSFQAHNFRQFLKFVHMFGWARVLTKPFHRIKIESSFNFRFLNFIEVDHPDVFASLLMKAYNESQRNEFLVYFRDKKDITLKAPRGWISAEQPYGLYCITLPQEETPEFLHPKFEGVTQLETTKAI